MRTEPDLGAVFEASPNAYMILDRELRYVAANRAYCAVTAHRRRRRTGKTPDELTRLLRETKDAPPIRPDARPHARADDGGLHSGDGEPECKPGGGATAPERHDESMGRRQVAGFDLIGQLECRVHMA